MFFKFSISQNLLSYLLSQYAGFVQSLHNVSLNEALGHRQQMFQENGNYYFVLLMCLFSCSWRLVFRKKVYSIVDKNLFVSKLIAPFVVKKSSVNVKHVYYIFFLFWLLICSSYWMVEYTKVKKCSLHYLPKYVTTNISFEIITLCEKWRNTEFFWPVFSVKTLFLSVKTHQFSVVVLTAILKMHHMLQYHLHAIG